MRCNLFKPITSGDVRMGTFLMFSQFTDDLTKEQSGKSTYRIVPSKFIALDLNINRAFNHTDWNPPLDFDGNGVSFDGNSYMICGKPAGVDAIIPQILQSYYENGLAYLRNQKDINWDDNNNYANTMLWRTLEDWGFIQRATYATGFSYYPEIKYIGDINIHSNKKVGAYNYDEVFCHIPAKEDEYFYPLDTSIEELPIQYNRDPVSETDDTRYLEDWNNITYPRGNNVLLNSALYYKTQGMNYYHHGGFIPVMDYNKEDELQPIPRNTDPNTGEVTSNSEYNFNAVIVFYDVLYSEPGEDPQYLHRYRPMGIYLSGGVQTEEDMVKAEDLKNKFTKYISNNDAYGQGASFGLRIMMRYVPTPNMSTYTMEVDGSGNDYETITQAMGGIADAIIDINRTCKDQQAMFQAYKDHLAQFRNNRTNVPYVRMVNKEPYWFVNGRNTGQKVYQES